MIAGGAIVSRTLVRGLAFAQVKTRVKRGRRGRIAGPTWGRHVKTAAFGAVLQVGAENFGDISFVAGQDDFSIFRRWLDEPWRMEVPSYEELSAIFQEGKFLPLPIALPDKKTALNPNLTQALLVKALVKESRLIPLGESLITTEQSSRFERKLIWSNFSSLPFVISPRSSQLLGTGLFSLLRTPRPF